MSPDSVSDASSAHRPVKLADCLYSRPSVWAITEPRVRRSVKVAVGGGVLPEYQRLRVVVPPVCRATKHRRLKGPLLMMTQEEYMDVLAMRRQGMSFVEIGEATGYHPATISKWVREGGPPPARTVADDGPGDRSGGGRTGSTSCSSGTPACWRRRCSRSSRRKASTGRIRRWRVGFVNSAVRGSGGPIRRRCRSRRRRARRPSSTSRTARRGRSESGSARCCGASG